MTKGLALIASVVSVLIAGALAYGDYGYYGYYDYPASPYIPTGFGMGAADGYYSPPPVYYYPPASPPVYPPVYNGPTAAGETCPRCPTCTAAAASSSASSKSSLQTGLQTLEAGECYCPYDNDWHQWALDDLRCQTALRSKCEVDSRLPCSWLNAYYAPSSSGSTRPFNTEIMEYVYNDCDPAPACNCANLTFTAKDNAADIYSCCQDLNVYLAMPITSLSKKVVNNYCTNKGNEVDIQKWVVHNLWGASCQGRALAGVYNYTSESSSKSNSQQSGQVTPRSTLGTSQSKGSTVAVAAAASGIGGAALGGLVAVGVITWWAKTRATPQHYGSLPGAATV